MGSKSTPKTHRAGRRPPPRPRSDAGAPALPPATSRAPAAAPLLEPRARAGDIAIRKVLVADGHLDEPLQCVPLHGIVRAHPVRLQHLVHLEVEAGVEQRGGEAKIVREATARGERGSG